MTDGLNTEAALLVHGLGGTPHELGALPAQLRKSGLKTYTMVLPGHGTHPAELKSVVMEQWVDALQQKLIEIQDQHKVVHLIGMCMGALLVCELAKSKSVSGSSENGKLVMLAPTLVLDGWRVPWYQALRYFHYVFPWLRSMYRIKEEAPFGIKNTRLRAIVQKRFARGDSFHYSWVPLQSIWQLDRLRKRVLTSLSTIRKETLIIHAREDEFSSLRSAHVLKSGIGAKAQIVVLENSYHMVCIDNDRDKAVFEILKFLRGGTKVS